MLTALTHLPSEQLTPTAAVAAAILEIVQLEQPPLRLALGAAAQGEIRRALT